MPETVQNLVTATHKYSKYKLSAALAVLVIFHCVGLWGMLFSSDVASFQKLTPLNLILTNVLLFAFHRNWNFTFILFAVVVAVVGFMAEVVGVHTGLLFGNYTYGASLGTKVWEVPLLIGLNWLMLVYTTGHIANQLKVPKLIKALIGAALMVLLDFLIEPVAMKYDFWDWKDAVIPASNFAGWLVLAFLLHIYFQTTAIFKKNVLAPAVYVIQLLFFLTLYLNI